MTLPISSLYSSLVGSSEQRLRTIIELVEKCAPIVVLLDEIDKGAAGATDGGGDAGTSKRLFSMLLQWLNDKPSNIFVIATANNPLGIYRAMPEMFRKGRFDEVFFVDLPTVSGRMDILKAHLATQGVELSENDLRDVAETAEDFTGSELKAIVDESAIDAYCNGENTITMGALKNAAMGARPIAKMKGTNIAAVRSWAKENARPAADPDSIKVAKRQKAIAASTGTEQDNIVI
jgi:SpoVK/Ycf46/Vps4 family AAA+-type ATPase